MTNIRKLHPALLYRTSLLVALFLLQGMGLFATHIVGAELYYECINSNTNLYEFTLIMYRDCDKGEADFDDELKLFVFETNNPSKMRTIQITKPANTPEIVPEGWDSCVGQPYTLCVEQAIYKVRATLPPRTGGYDAAWARCCRNGSITNLNDPLCQGATFLAHIPGPEDAICNSSPVFKNRLPIFICVNNTFTFDHSAIDPDGDSLVYKMGTPFDGINFQGLGAGNPDCFGPPPVVDVFNPNNPMGPPPYKAAQYLFGFSPTNPFGFNTASLDPNTGILILTPPQIGIFVLAVSVQEYRNGVLLSENKVDLQIHVIQCLDAGAPPIASHDLTGVDSSNPGISITYASNDTIYAVAGTPFCYEVTVEDSILTDSVISFPVSNIFGNGNFFPPAAVIKKIGTGINPIKLEVCWAPACEYIGQTLPLIIGGRDQVSCPGHNFAYDTVFIKVVDPPIVFPQVTYDLSLAPNVIDTIILEVDSSMCFNWWVTDTANTGHLGYDILVEEVGGNGSFSPSTQVSKFADSIAFVTCWTAECTNMGKLYRVIMVGTDNSVCPPDNEDRDTIYVRIPTLPNPPPVMNHDLTGNLFVNDTIIVDVHDTLCYTFTIQDTFLAVNLNYQFSIENITGGYQGHQPSKVKINASNPLEVRVCWTPNCDNVNGTFRLVVEGIQENRCTKFASTFDTVYVIVNDLLNPPPTISHEFIPGYQLIGDTLIIEADSTVCFDFTLRDSVWRSYLNVKHYVELMPGGSNTGHNVSVNFQTQKDTLLEGRICFTPGCEYANSLLRVITEGKDTFDCLPANWVYDTVYIQVDAPYNQPPVISHNLGNLSVQNGIVNVEPNGIEYCYTVILEDPDSLYADLTASGISDIFSFEFGNGNSATATITGINPLLIEVCWNPSCYEQTKEFTMTICGRDTSRCQLTPEVCDSVRFYVDSCKIVIQNVFTPNRDGFNDLFLPFDMTGVEYYTLWIFDRWGKRVYEIKDGPWDGSVNDGTEASEGVYYWIVEYQMWSAQGNPIRAKKAGNVTLLR